jgi:hypothetical protein
VISLLALLVPVAAASTPTEVALAVPDIAVLRAEDRYNSTVPGAPWRYGATIAQDLTTTNSGEWTTQEDGSRQWRLHIEAPGAKHLKLLLSDLNLPTGTTLTLDSGRDLVRYTARTGFLGTRPVSGDTLDITLDAPAGTAADLSIDSVVYGYRTFGPQRSDLLGSSGTCNVNAACTAADDWRTETESAVLLDIGSSVCSGTLINNTAQDQAPLILTANHCFEGSDVRQWSAWFNYESEGCDNPQTEPAADILYGASALAATRSSDMALILMDEEVPPEFGAFFAGWDATGRTPDFTVAIHHPAGDIKKFTYDADPPGTDGSYWYIGSWDLGTTEGGSSGSGLYDESGRVIGHLFGGDASCFNPGGGDSYGAVSRGWDGDGTSTTRLSDHLDPLGIDPGTWDGFGEGGLPIEAGVSMISPTDGGTSCGQSIVVEVKNNGADRLTRVDFEVDVGGEVLEATWRGGLDFNETEAFTIEVALEDGSQDVTVTIVEANREEDPVLGNNTTRARFDVVDVVGDELPAVWNMDDNTPLVTRENPQMGVTWQLVDVPGRGVVAGMNNLDTENIGHIDAMVLGTFEIQGGKPLVEFDYAYAQYREEFSDGLRLVAINACDAVETIVWELAGADLATAPMTEDPFVPTEDQWESIKVDLSDFSDQTVTLEIQNVGAWGQWVYVDNVEVRKQNSLLGCRCDVNGSPAQLLWALPLALLFRRRRCR